ncbi:tail completion and sheath stabilizer protein [Agrobacterium phage OLIVR5]|uniref:Tail completion and sheath stabilizer protein n=1 Tax=Agrobacterium phage OLIVR5 TaxID=2723773 RepID=A0A858MV62_9CAUD|nr:tail completion and sheath stabilizer protein [Agrobacterium phage OLIVR5]QIW87850.1 tail completion and sheath stabilizer protein [Agrobacterium phage OLIVR5]QIW88115.1 tail completion and sheath stabilizer protein [Agrobacterium phage OLIVR6]
MAENKDKLNNSHTDNFVFTCPKLPKTSLRAVDIIMPGISLDTTDIPIGQIIERLPGAVWRPDDLVLTWIMDEKWETYMEVLSWTLKIKTSDETEIPSLVSNASLTILDNHGRGVVGLRYTSLFPRGVNSISFSSNSGVAPVVYGIATFGLSNIEVDTINGNVYEDSENLVRP